MMYRQLRCCLLVASMVDAVVGRSLDHVRCRFLQLSLWVWQGLRSMLPPVPRSEDRASRHVFFPEGMISCLPRRKL